jgi:hypothetical protein
MAKKSPLRIMPPDALNDPFDPSTLGPLPVVPLVPGDILSRHKVLVPTDSRFRSAARLLQALWRQDRDLPIGSYVDANGKRCKLGSRITEAAGRQGSNFLAPEIAVLVRRECVYRELGALIEVERLRENLLSSMPLTFNIFAPLKLDLRHATRFMNELFPGFIKEVLAIKFEHSPGRGKSAYTGDYSAFDLCFYGLTNTGERALLGWEVKYSEGGVEPLPQRISDRHFQIVGSSNLFLESEDPTLFSNPLQQLTREHCLAQSILDRGDVDVGMFVLASPLRNHLTQQMGETYATKLAPPGKRKVAFAALTLERLLEALVAIGMVSHAQALHRRYLDFWQVDGELEVMFAKARHPRKQNKATPAELQQIAS